MCLHLWLTKVLLLRRPLVLHIVVRAAYVILRAVKLLHRPLLLNIISGNVLVYRPIVLRIITSMVNVGNNVVVLLHSLHIVIGKVVRLHSVVVISGLIMKPVQVILLMNLVSVNVWCHCMVNVANVHRCNIMTGSYCNLISSWARKISVVIMNTVLVNDIDMCTESSKIITAIKTAVS